MCCTSKRFEDYDYFELFEHVDVFAANMCRIMLSLESTSTYVCGGVHTTSVVCFVFLLWTHAKDGRVHIDDGLTECK